MRRLAFILWLFAHSTVHASERTYRFDLAQFDDGGIRVESAEWSCTESELRARQCARSIMLLVDAKRLPVELSFWNEGTFIDVTVTSGSWRLDTRGAGGRFDKRGKISTVMQVFDTGERVEPNVPLSHKPVVRRREGPLLARLTLVIERRPPR
jgi:hypothetical protein